MPKCSFGCGKKAIKQFKTGRWCCSNSTSSCSAQKAKNSASKKGINPWEGREHPRGMAGKTSWNSGKSKYDDATLMRASKKLKKRIRKDGAFGFRKGDKHTEATKKRISETMKANGSGGYRIGSGRGKKGWYKGIHCDSSWELAFVLWCELKGRQVKRAKKRFEYTYKKQSRKYLPDFRYRTSKGVWKYLEIKGYVSEQWKAKKKAFPHELLLISRKTMEKKILPVVVEAHGKDFIELYERRD